MKSHKVIYSYIRDSLSSEIVNRMSKIHEFHPVFIHSNNSIKNFFKKNHPNVLFADSMSIRKGIFPFHYFQNKITVDRLIIDKLSTFQSNVMGRFEDSTGFNFSYKQRLNFYYDMLSFWNTVIINLKPELFISYTWPHVQSDYALYLLCKYIYNIPVIFIDPYPHFHNRYAIMSDMVKRS